MLASVLQSCCELSGPKLGPCHDGRGGGVCDPAVTVPGSEVSDAGGEVQPAS